MRQAIWTSIAEALRGEISSGHYPPGAKLPTEAALSARFSVNRHTVRHALEALASEGLVNARRGSGVFVTLTPTLYPLSRRVRFHQNVLATGRTPDRQLTRRETRPADAVEAKELKIGVSEQVHVVEGISLADGVPIATFRSIFPAVRFPGLLAEMDKTNSVTAALKAVGVADYTRLFTRLTAKLASATLALRLQIREGAPVLRSISVNVDSAGCPVEYGKTWFVGDRVTLSVSPE